MSSIADLLARTNGPSIEIDRTVALTRDVTRKAHDYWLSRREGRPWPARRDITPQGMKDFVRNIGLVEIRTMADGHGTYFIRLAGAKIESVYGAITGKTLSEFLPAALEARWRMVFDAAIAERAPVRLATRVMFGGKSYLAAEVLLAPLGEGDVVSMLYAAVDVWPAVPGPATATDQRQG
jgi:hypothetical protein